MEALFIWLDILEEMVAQLLQAAWQSKTKNNTNLQNSDKTTGRQPFSGQNRLLKHKRRFCRESGCGRIVKSQGLCQRHGAKPKKCKIDRCEKQAQGSFDGMCSKYIDLFLNRIHVMHLRSNSIFDQMGWLDFFFHRKNLISGQFAVLHAQRVQRSSKIKIHLLLVIVMIESLFLRSRQTAIISCSKTVNRRFKTLLWLTELYRRSKIK